MTALARFAGLSALVLASWLLLLALCGGLLWLLTTAPALGVLALIVLVAAGVIGLS